MPSLLLVQAEVPQVNNAWRCNSYDDPEQNYNCRKRRAWNLYCRDLTRCQFHPVQVVLEEGEAPDPYALPMLASSSSLELRNYTHPKTGQSMPVYHCSDTDVARRVGMTCDTFPFYNGGYPFLPGRLFSAGRKQRKQHYQTSSPSAGVEQEVEMENQSHTETNHRTDDEDGSESDADRSAANEGYDFKDKNSNNDQLIGSGDTSSEPRGRIEWDAEWEYYTCLERNEWNNVCISWLTVEQSFGEYEVGYSNCTRVAQVVHQNDDGSNNNNNNNNSMPIYHYCQTWNTKQRETKKCDEKSHGCSPNCSQPTFCFKKCCRDSQCYDCSYTPHMEMEYTEGECITVNDKGACLEWKQEEYDEHNPDFREYEHYQCLQLSENKQYCQRWIGETNSEEEFEIATCECLKPATTTTSKDTMSLLSSPLHIATARSGYGANGVVGTGDGPPFCQEWTCYETGYDYYFPNLLWTFLPVSICGIFATCCCLCIRDHKIEGGRMVIVLYLLCALGFTWIAGTLAGLASVLLACSVIFLLFPLSLCIYYYFHRQWYRRRYYRQYGKYPQQQYQYGDFRIVNARKWWWRLHQYESTGTQLDEDGDDDEEDENHTAMIPSSMHSSSNKATIASFHPDNTISTHASNHAHDYDYEDYYNNDDDMTRMMTTMKQQEDFHLYPSPPEGVSGGAAASLSSSSNHNYQDANIFSIPVVEALPIPWYESSNNHNNRSKYYDSQYRCVKCQGYKCTGLTRSCHVKDKKSSRRSATKSLPTATKRK